MTHECKQAQVFPKVRHQLGLDNNGLVLGGSSSNSSLADLIAGQWLPEQWLVHAMRLHLQVYVGAPNPAPTDTVSTAGVRLYAEWCGSWHSSNRMLCSHKARMITLQYTWHKLCTGIYTIHTNSKTCQ